MYDEIIDGILSGRIKTRKHLQRAKIEACEKYSLIDLPKNSDILLHTPNDPVKSRIIRSFLMNKPVRSLSGIVAVAVMTSPAQCPHGKCIYCPGGVENNSPQSYTGREPAALRGAHDNFDPFRQTSARLVQLNSIGHPTDKVELIVMGGTFPARPYEYQEWFVKRCYDAMNGVPGNTLEEAHMLNETSVSRCIGMTVESRPDWCREIHVDRMLALGTTRVELGVQSLNDDILLSVGRGHTSADTVRATRVAKDSGIKVCYHLMPGLPGSSADEDIRCFRKIFEDDNFRPDMLKIYPTLVIKGTKLYDEWNSGRYVPYTTEQAAELIAEAKKYVPKWVRIQRIQRDIPAHLIEAGVKKSHLRTIVREIMESSGARCKCIRCREVGLTGRLIRRRLDDVDSFMKRCRLVREPYSASGGKEIFLSYEIQPDDLLVGYARLRFPSESAHRDELRNGKTAIVRELKVFGGMVELNHAPAGSTEWQHRGFGRALLSECERISADEGYRYLLVNSGIGVKPYYRRLGYNNIGGYVGKELPM